MTSELDRTILELAPGVEMAFRRIPAGSFRMGSRGEWASEEPVHLVQIAQPFWMAETPVTQEQFAVWTRAAQIDHQNDFENRAGHPAENTDWYLAVTFCAWVTRVMADELPDDGKLACLPTEAEWEYACRAGTDTEYHTGDGAAALHEAGWFDESWESGSTHPVRLKAPNGFQLFDMHGNVWEWCHDVYEAAAYRNRGDDDRDPGWKQRVRDCGEQQTPSGDDNQDRVLRGGSWFSRARRCRSACRVKDRPGDRDWGIGFRVCLVRGPVGQGGAEQERDGANAEREPGGRRPRDEAGVHGTSVAGAEPQAACPEPRFESILTGSPDAMNAIPPAPDPRIIDSAEGVPDWSAWGREVQKIVLGEPHREDERTPFRVGEPLPIFAERFPNLTHLYFWQIEGIDALPALPEGLKCLDVRGCSDLRSLPELPSGLETLVLENCPRLTLDPAKETVKFADLSDVSVKGCPLIAQEWLDAVLESAPRLRWLNASNCLQLERIKKWPPEVVDVRLNGCTKLKQLPEYWPVRLRRLELRGATRIDQLEDFTDHEVLDYLDLAGTINLAELPERPERLRTLFLYGSGILVPPASEHGEGSEDNVAERTREFFHDIELAGKGEVRRCKVLMLGNGSAGKTCLSLALHPETDPGEEARRLGTTHGVRFDEWIIETEIERKARKVTAHIWDFGGQEIYHNTHRLFMEVGAVFVVLWKPEQDGKRAEVDENGYQDDWRPLRYWIDFVKMACPQRPEILVVCSHRAERSEELVEKAYTEIGEEDETGYKLFFVDSKTRSGEFEPFVEQLKNTIGKTIERQGVKVPAHWEIAQEMAKEWLRALQGQESPATENIYRTVDEFGDELRKYLERRLRETEPHQYPKAEEGPED